MLPKRSSRQGNAQMSLFIPDKKGLMLACDCLASVLELCQVIDGQAFADVTALPSIGRNCNTLG